MNATTIDPVLRQFSPYIKDFAYVTHSSNAMLNVTCSLGPIPYATAPEITKARIYGVSGNTLNDGAISL